uniref:Glutamate receptor n=1 Tax=Araucaria cunninghamii TaxID=56994 RepID=A0A0D6QS63_ARACU
MHPIKLLLLFIVFNVSLLATVSADDTINIAAILDLNTAKGREVNLSLHMAAQDINLTTNGSRLNISVHEFDTSVGNVFQALRTEAVAILVQAPKISRFIAPIAETLHIPIFSFGGENKHGNARRSRYIVSPAAIHSEAEEMKVIADVVQEFLWKEVIVIYEDVEFWLTGVYTLNKALEQVEGRISQAAAVSSLSGRDEFKKILQQLNEGRVRAFIVCTRVDVAVNILSVAKELGMMEEAYAWVVTDSTASSLDSLNSSSIATMQGILGIKRHIALTAQLTEFQERLRLSSLNYGMDGVWIRAYDCLNLIARAVAALISEDEGALQFADIGITEGNMDFAGMRVLRGGKLLLEQINCLKPSVVRNSGEHPRYEIINVVGRSYRTVGLWTTDKGLKSPTSKNKNLSAVIWPGDTAVVPNGYRKLIVGRINKPKTASDFTEFIGRFSGYTIDTFEAAVKGLPYNLPFEIKYFKKGGSNLSNYDALVTELVNGKKYDIVVGDATILWNRSNYVDFSQPYTSTGLVMMVPMRKVRNRTWSFLYPFTAGLWAIAGALFVFTAFLVWLMERHDSEEFNGGIANQIVTSLTFSLSAFVFAQREDVKSALGKGIVAAWLFTALILNNSYTAHLTSILTVEKLVPTLTSMDSLTTSNIKVGYLNGSFTRNYLINDLRIPKERLVALKNPSDYVEKLIKEKVVGAIVDETPYIQVVKTLYPCANFAIVDRGYFETGGFGYFFRKGSPFLADISEAVLKVSEQHNLVESIRSKWFGERSSCPDAQTGLDSKSNPISPNNLWILFVLTACIYVITALIHIGRKLKLKERWRSISMPVR